MTTAEHKRLEALVSGRVQGVSFRYYTQRKAISLGLKGWVRNEASGQVRTVAEGDEQSLREFLSFLHQGSPYAQVSGVEFDWKTFQGEFTVFQVTR